MIKSILQLLVEQVFSSNGAIVQCGGRYNAQQAKYSDYVVQVLEEKGSVTGLLEAETGIGKTMVYLICSLIYLNIQHKPKKIIISTFTRMLQRQILSSDLEFAIKVLGVIGIKNKVKCAYRMGKQAFFSMSRVEAAVNDLRDKYPLHAQEYEEFARFAHASCVSGTGLWLDWLEDNLNFPPHMTQNDICLLQHQSVDNPAYSLHLNEASNAGLLITNHMTILAQTFEDEYSAIFFDEAHELPMVCSQLFNHKFPLVEMAHTIEQIKADLLNKRYMKPFLELVQEWDAVLRSNDTSHNFWTDRTHKKLIDSQVGKAQELYNYVERCEKDFKKLSSSDGLNSKAAELLSKLETIKLTLKKWLSQDETFQHRAIGFSAKLRNPSVASVNPYAGRIFAKRIGKLTNRIILVSATLSDAKKEVSFSSICFGLGLDDSNLVKCSIAPLNYGHMSFVLCDPTIPKPVIMDGEETLFSGRWITNTVEMIKAALSTGRTILVLTQSFDEAKYLAENLNSTKVAHHIKGKPLDMYLKKLVDDEVQCLITPSAWEGVSIRRKDGSQLFKHVVIARIPFKPIDGLMELIRSERGNKGILWIEQSYQAVNKLKQGMGRGNRHPDDDVVIHFCDPRMPHYYDQRSGNRNLISAIPKRFIENYAQAPVFGKATKKVVML